MMNEYALQVEQLRLKFPGEDSLVFQDLSISIKHQEKVLILGPSGSGKSTLLQVLSGIIPSFYEVPLTYQSLKRAEQWGYVFQDPETQFCMNIVNEELAFVLENRNIDRDQMEPLMQQVLEQVGLNIDLHTPISSLSQGMKQRLALASVLLLEPSIIFLDEPSALLDPEGKTHIWSSLRHTLQHHTVVVVEHHIDGILDWFDRIIILDHQGAIIAEGNATEIFHKQRHLLDQYGIWHPHSWESFLTESSPLPKDKKIRNNLQLPILQLRDYDALRGGQSVCYAHDADAFRGDWITITGRNGAGKSSLLLSLAGLIESRGSLFLNEKLVKQHKKHIPAELSLIFQSPELQFIADTVLDELLISLAPPEQAYKAFIKKQGKQYLSFIQERLAHYQLDLPLDRHPYQCSVGQKKRLSLLTAFVKHTPILLLDEPTFGQDARNTFIILRTLMELTEQGATIIMITHDPMIVNHLATKQWHISDGKLQVINLHSQDQGENACEQLAKLVEA